MPNVFVANLDFEHHLSSGEANQIPEAARMRRDDLACVWLGIASDDDAILVLGPPDDSFADELRDSGLTCPRFTIDPHDASGSELIPWGWTEAIRRLADRSGCHIDPVNQAAVIEVNSRSFSFALEGELGVRVDHAAMCRSTDELERHLRNASSVDGGWCLKSQFGMAGRGMVRGTGRQVPDTIRTWVQRQLENNDAVFFEPWLDSVKEAGVLFEISSDGTVQHLTAAEMLCSPSGAYVGSLIRHSDVDDADWTDAVATGRQAAARIRDVGYVGPLGIDAMRFRDQAGQLRLRPLQDINARYTMGHMAAGFRRFLSPGDHAAWRHVVWNTGTGTAPEWLHRLRQRVSSSVRVLRTSPFTIGGRETIVGTVLIISSDRQALDAAIRES